MRILPFMHVDSAFTYEIKWLVWKTEGNESERERGPLGLVACLA